MLNITEFLDINNSQCPDSVAIDFYQIGPTTYRQLQEQIERFSTGLYKLGFQAGDHIALALSNSPEFIVAYLAIIRAGMVVIPLNIMVQKMELEYQLADSEAVGLIATKRFIRIYEEIAPSAIQVKRVIVAERDDSKQLQWQGIDLTSRDMGKCAATSFDTLAQITYTAAMDGYPMGAMLTHGNLWSNCLMTAKGMGAQSEDRILSAIPLFHTYGAMANCLVTLSLGATIKLQSRFNPKEFLECMKQDRVTIVNGVPALYASLIQHDMFHPDYFSSVRNIISGGAALPLEISQKYRELGLEIREGYGLTECSPCVSVNPPHGHNKLTSIGSALEGVNIKIVDSEGNDCPVGKEGELLVSGPLVMKGYWKKPEATARTIVNGWLHTGDIAVKDNDHYYYIKGRLKHMLITGGFNVYPREVERLLGTNPKIQSVVVESIPDAVQGEFVKAVIRLKPGETATEREFIHYSKHIMSIYKVPRVVQIVP